MPMYVYMHMVAGMQLVCRLSASLKTMEIFAFPTDRFCNMDTP